MKHRSIIFDMLLTSLCPQPGSEAAAQPAEARHEAGGQTRSQVSVCGAGEELSLGCVYKDKQPSIWKHPRKRRVTLKLMPGPNSWEVGCLRHAAGVCWYLEGGRMCRCWASRICCWRRYCWCNAWGRKGGAWMSWNWGAGRGLRGAWSGGPCWWPGGTRWGLMPDCGCPGWGIGKSMGSGAWGPNWKCLQEVAWLCCCCRLKWDPAEDKDKLSGVRWKMGGAKWAEIVGEICQCVCVTAC